MTIPLRKILYAVLGLLFPGAALVYGPFPASAATAGPINGECVDIAPEATLNGTKVRLYNCNSAQIWAVGNSSGEPGKCRNIKIEAYDCNGSRAQMWAAANRALVDTGSGKCLDAKDQNKANDNQLQIWMCTAEVNQKWSMPGGGPASITSAPAATGLDDPAKKEVAMELVSAAENSSLDWRAQYPYIEDIGDGRGYTAGIIGFCSGTGDLLELIEAYTATKPDNILAKYLPALREVNNSDSHAGLDPSFTGDWQTAAADPAFQAAQDAERDRVYFNPSVADGKSDGLGALGQFVYYDAAVMHGHDGLRSIRARVLKKAKPPAQGGNETAWLNAFLDERVAEMKKEEAHTDTSRVDTEQRVFLSNGNLDLTTPLAFAVYGDQYIIH